jgi:hypothetical protein
VVVAMSRRSVVPHCQGWRFSARDGGTAAGMAAQGGGDGEETPRWPDVAASSRPDAG